MTIGLTAPFPSFFGRDGKPLDGGFIYYGVANSDPQNNPVAVYWDQALSIPAVQPIRTAGGFPVYNGTPANLYTASDCSVRVLDRNGAFVFALPTVPVASDAIDALQTIADMTALAKSSLADDTTVVALGYYAVGDGGGGMFQWSSASTATADGGLVIITDEGGAGRWLRAFDAPEYSLLWFGAATALTNSANKAILQTAITAVGTAGGGVIEVPYTINYGRKTRTPATWPSFTGITNPIMIRDYSRGDTQNPDVYPTAYDGAQCVEWYFTPQTTSPGQHDGNTFWVRGAWAPAFCVANDMDLAAVGNPARTAFDNRRAYYATMVDGEANWQLGNGTLAGAGYTDEELSNFLIEKFAMAGDTLGGYVPYLVERKTGNVSYSGGRNVPGAHHHFDRTPGTPGLDIAMFEAGTTTATVVLRNSDGSGDDVAVRNLDGALHLVIPALGPALTVAKTTRNVGIGVDAPIYRLDVAATIGDYLVRARNLHATNPYGFRLEGGGAGGAGWTFGEWYSNTNTAADLEFKFTGDGNGTCDGAWTGGGADYAEYFEWADGNPANEDRRGLSVVLDGGMIRPAREGENPFGVVSGNPSVVGDAAPFRWAGKYLRDDYGTALTETFDAVTWEVKTLVRKAKPATEHSDAEVARYETQAHSYPVDAVPKGVAVPDDAERTTGTRRVLNPDYVEGADYVPRADRPEWATVGLVGKLRVRTGQPVGDRWIKMRDVSAIVSEWLVR